MVIASTNDKVKLGGKQLVKGNKIKGEKKKSIPQDNYKSSDSIFPIVVLGSSAGGLEANEAFFKNVTSDSDMAYIVISHLEPHHVSLLAEIISKTSTIKAVQAEDGMVVCKNNIYVIPPGKNMIITDGTLHLSDRGSEQEPFLPIDHFFRSLAEDRREDAIAVILSGNASDGSLGIKAIHSNLGMIMVQSPENAKYNSMPRSAIETGLVDYILPPNEMPGMIMRYVRAKIRSPKVELVGASDAVQKILSIVKNGTGHDLSLYKKSTINRRIVRRMSVHQLQNKEQYSAYLKANPQETNLLLKDMLIEVTNFFRNPETFESLKETLKKTFFLPNSQKDELRVWVTGCSTGEEVYSIGIILKELIDETGKSLHIQMFGSDINMDAIETARKGVFPLEITEDVDAKRLDKYFIRQENGYKVKKEIREMVVFAPHDVIRDPPFIHLDLLSCRNLLIYFEPVLQRRVLETFSTALNPNGIMLLGESETISGFEDRYIPIDTKQKIYRRRPFSPFIPTRETSVPLRTNKEKDICKDKGPEKIIKANEKAEKILLSEHTPPCLIVNEKNEITYFHGRTSKYLEHAQGKASLSINDLLLEDLRYEVILTINESRKSGKTVVREAVQVHNNGETSFLNIIVRPLEERSPITDVLVIFDEKNIPRDILRENQELAISPNRETRLNELEGELRFTKDNLRSTIEQLETSNEELTSTNEELQSNNEELQSVVEESETGKEELNSLNEELLTVNSELERKNQELSTINSDTRNLLYSVDEAIVFLDTNLRIRRFTPQTEKIMNLLPGDVGRPIQDIASKLRYEDLLNESKEVLDTLNTKEKEVQTKEGRWFKVKLLPYRTVENLIDGVVLTFSDIDEQKKVQDKLNDLSLKAQESQEYAESIVNTIKEPLLILDDKLIIRSANMTFFNQFDTSSEDVQGQPLDKILSGMWNIPSMLDRLKELSSKEAELENLSTEITISGSEKKTVDITARKLLIPSGSSKLMLFSIQMKG